MPAWPSAFRAGPRAGMPARAWRSRCVSLSPQAKARSSTATPSLVRPGLGAQTGRCPRDPRRSCTAQRASTDEQRRRRPRRRGVGVERQLRRLQSGIEPDHERCAGTDDGRSPVGGMTESTRQDGGGGLSACDRGDAEARKASAATQSRPPWRCQRGPGGARCGRRRPAWARPGTETIACAAPPATTRLGFPASRARGSAPDPSVGAASLLEDLKKEPAVSRVRAGGAEGLGGDHRGEPRRALRPSGG